MNTTFVSFTEIIIFVYNSFSFTVPWPGSRTKFYYIRRVSLHMASAWKYLREKASFTFPVLAVVAFSSVLVYVALLSSIQVQAVVFEGEAGEAPVWQGILNALIFIGPAVIFAFVIAYMVKRKRMNVLKVFFGSALFITTSIITFFFIILMDDLIWSKIGYIRWDYVLAKLDTQIPVYLLGVYPGVSMGAAMTFSGFMGILLAGTIFSKRMKRDEKNWALLMIGGLMGSFLSFILPWWTVVPMLLGLVIYDIYAVYKGPIRTIFEESQTELERGLQEAWKNKDECEPKTEVTLEKEKTKKGKGEKHVPSGELADEEGERSRIEVEEDRRAKLIQEYREKAAKERSQKKTVKKRQSLLSKFTGGGGGLGQEEFTEDLLSSMTYGTDDWELGIGDLVFYGMLGSHSLKIGADLIPTFGIFAPWIFFATTLVGILIGFFITLKLLERNVLLPGLPIPIVLGLACMGLTYLGFVIFL